MVAGRCDRLPGSVSLECNGTDFAGIFLDEGVWFLPIHPIMSAEARANRPKAGAPARGAPLASGRCGREIELGTGPRYTGAFDSRAMAGSAKG